MSFWMSDKQSGLGGAAKQQPGPTLLQGSDDPPVFEDDVTQQSLVTAVHGPDTSARNSETPFSVATPSLSRVSTRIGVAPEDTSGTEGGAARGGLGAQKDLKTAKQLIREIKDYHRALFQFAQSLTKYAQSGATLSKLDTSKLNTLEHGHLILDDIRDNLLAFIGELAGEGFEEAWIRAYQKHGLHRLETVSDTPNQNDFDFGHRGLIEARREKLPAIDINDAIEQPFFSTSRQKEQSTPATTKLEEESNWPGGLFFAYLFLTCGYFAFEALTPWGPLVHAIKLIGETAFWQSWAPSIGLGLGSAVSIFPFSFKSDLFFRLPFGIGPALRHMFGTHPKKSALSAAVLLGAILVLAFAVKLFPVTFVGLSAALFINTIILIHKAWKQHKALTAPQPATASASLVVGDLTTSVSEQPGLDPRLASTNTLGATANPAVAAADAQPLDASGPIPTPAPRPPQSHQSQQDVATTTSTETKTPAPPDLTGKNATASASGAAPPVSGPVPSAETPTELYGRARLKNLKELFTTANAIYKSLIAANTAYKRLEKISQAATESSAAQMMETAAESSAAKLMEADQDEKMHLALQIDVERAQPHFRSYYHKTLVDMGLEQKFCEGLSQGLFVMAADKAAVNIHELTLNDAFARVFFNIGLAVEDQLGRRERLEEVCATNTNQRIEQVIASMLANEPLQPDEVKKLESRVQTIVAAFPPEHETARAVRNNQEYMSNIFVWKNAVRPRLDAVQRQVTGYIQGEKKDEALRASIAAELTDIGQFANRPVTFSIDSMHVTAHREFFRTQVATLRSSLQSIPRFEASPAGKQHRSSVSPMPDKTEVEYKSHSTKEDIVRRILFNSFTSPKPYKTYKNLPPLKEVKIPVKPPLVQIGPIDLETKTIIKLLEWYAEAKAVCKSEGGNALTNELLTITRLVLETMVADETTYEPLLQQVEVWRSTAQARFTDLPHEKYFQEIATGSPSLQARFPKVERPSPVRTLSTFSTGSAANLFSPRGLPFTPKTPKPTTEQKQAQIPSPPWAITRAKAIVRRSMRCVSDLAMVGDSGAAKSKQAMLAELQVEGLLKQLISEPGNKELPFVFDALLQELQDVPEETSQNILFRIIDWLVSDQNSVDLQPKPSFANAMEKRNEAIFALLEERVTASDSPIARAKFNCLLNVIAEADPEKPPIVRTAWRKADPVHSSLVRSLTFTVPPTVPDQGVSSKSAALVVSLLADESESSEVLLKSSSSSSVGA